MQERELTYNERARLKVARAMSWRERVDYALQDKEFQVEDKVLAQSWLTCAIGERDEVERRGAGLHSPVDDRLLVLGLRFATAVEMDDPWRAETLLQEIAKRVEELQQEQQGRG